MFYICLDIDGIKKYLYNWRVAVYLPDYARTFPTRFAAQRYMKDKQVAREHAWWVVKME